MLKNRITASLGLGTAAAALIAAVVVVGVPSRNARAMTSCATTLSATSASKRERAFRSCYREHGGRGPLTMYEVQRFP